MGSFSGSTAHSTQQSARAIGRRIYSLGVIISSSGWGHLMSNWSPIPNCDATRVLQMLEGYRATCLIASGIQLGLIEALRDAPVSEEDLAHTLGAHQPSLRRFLRALGVLGIVQDQQSAVGLTSMGRLLLKDASALRDRAILIAEEHLPAWANLRQSALTGNAAFDDVFGMNVWQHRKEHPHLGESFNRIMVNDQVQSQRAVLDAYDFESCNLIVDVGGGHGALISQLLAKYPRLSGVLFDQPWVLEGATSGLAAAGVLHRCRLVGGSFFDSLPAGGDVYLLQHILHDWDDENCLKILRGCCAAMGSSSTLLVVENIMPESPAEATNVVMLDIHMMAVLGGRERTFPEYEALLTSAGFAPPELRETRAKTAVILTNAKHKK